MNMNQLTFSIEIQASKQDVWHVLWDDATFRQWAGLIDPGAYMKGELIQGKTVEFISSENGYGVTSFVEEVEPTKYLLLKHHADTQNVGAELRSDEWTGGSEEYRLQEQGDAVVLTAVFDVPPEMKKYFEENYPIALEKVKELAEKNELHG